MSGIDRSGSGDGGICWIWPPAPTSGGAAVAPCADASRALAASAVANRLDFNIATSAPSLDRVTSPTSLTVGYAALEVSDGLGRVDDDIVTVS
jgi:hypothetical protein